MERLEIGDDPGFFEISLAGNTVRLDAFEANNKLCDIIKEAGNDQNKANLAIAIWLKDLLHLDTPPSLAVVVKVMDYIFDRVDAIRKKLGGPPALPSTSQESTPSS
ncbi:MAG: hypothetical protein JNJ77_20040 [Planctomycetia bacterium]|nr:hypothetical protein [Planctomycetia bacterium]